MLRGAIFDFGGTLAYEADPAGLLAARQAAVRRVLGPLGVGPGAADRAWEDVLARLDRLEHDGTPVSAATAAATLVDAVAGPGHDAAVAHLRAELVRPSGHPQQLRLVDAAGAVVAALAEEGVRCAVLSNTGLSSGRHNVEWLDEVGLLPFFVPGAVLFSDELGVGKPDPEAFERCRARLGVDRHDVVHVGDDLWFDVHGARGAGLATVRVRRFGVERRLPDADVVVDDLVDVPAALGRVLRRAAAPSGRDPGRGGGGPRRR